MEDVKIDFNTKQAFILGNGASCTDDTGKRMSKSLEKAGYGGKLVEIKQGSKDEPKAAESPPFEAGAGRCVVTLQVSGMS